jgi:hypothetical protein
VEPDFHHEPRLPERRLPAWLFSLLFHLSWIALLSMVLDVAPRGSAEEPGRTAGIVLKRVSEEGELYEGEESVASDETAPAVNLSREQLEASLPSESSAPDLSRDLPAVPTLGAGATAGGGTPNAADFTSGGQAGAPPAGGEASVRVFGVEGVGTKFVYVFDRSTSMEGAPLAAAKQQLLDSLRSLDSIHQFHIIFFNNELRRLELTGSGNRVAFATDRNKNLAARFVGSITADGGTDRLSALREAVALRPDVIFFLTDADSPMPQSELAQIARLNRRGNASICSIEFGQGPLRHSNNFLMELARITGGQYGYVDTMRLGQ